MGQKNTTYLTENPLCFCQRQIPGGTKDKVLIGENSALRRTEECYMWTEKYIVLKNTSPVYLNIFYLIIVCRHVCVYVQPPPHFFFTKERRKGVLKIASLLYAVATVTWVLEKQVIIQSH